MGNPYRAITVEPVVVLYITALLLQLPVYQHYVYHRAQVELLANNQSDLADESHCNANSSKLQDEIQRRASNYILAIGMAGTFPAIFSSLIYGPVSDRKGRIPIMKLPPLGSLIDVSIALATIYLELPLYIMAIGSAISGVCGQYTTLVFTVTAYVTDTTSDPGKLSLRLARLEAMALFGGTIAQVTSGLWVQHLGYAAPYWFLFACYFTSFVYITFSLPESHHGLLPHGDKSCYSCKDLQLLAGVIIKTRHDNGRMKVLLMLLVSVFLLLPVGVLNQLVILYAKDYPLCWKADFIGYFLACLFFGRAVGAVVCLKLLKLFSWKDYSVIQLGSVFLMGLLVMIGLSTTTLDMFLATIPGLMVGLTQPCIRALISHIVDYSEQGSLFAIIASIESLCSFLASIIFNPVYQTSLDYTWQHANGLIFFINAGIVFIPLVIISYLKFHESKGYEPLDGISNTKRLTTSSDSSENED